MPKFRVVQYREACVVYHAYVQAETKEEAKAKAEADDCTWEEQDDVLEYDDREISLDEIEEVPE